MAREVRKQAPAKLAVRVKPRSSKSGVEPAAGEVVVRVHAPAVKGAANREMVEVLSQALGVAKSCVRIVSGERSSRKLVEVSGLSTAEAAARLGRGDRS